MEEKMSLFSRFINSMTKLDAYECFIKHPLKKAIAYLFIVAILFGGISSIKIISNYNTTINQLLNSFKIEVPDFLFKNGELEVNAEMPYIITNEGDPLVVIIDTSQSLNDNLLDGYEKGMFITKSGAISKENIFETRKYNFSIFRDVTFTKDDLLKYLPYLKWLSIVIIIFTLSCYICGKFISAFILSICGIAIQKILNYKVGFKDLYKLSVYTLTLPILFKTIISVTDLKIPYFFVIYYGTALVYLWMVIKNLRKKTIDTTRVPDLEELQN